MGKKYLTLPSFPIIKPEELNPLDVCFNLDTNKFTAWGEHTFRKYPYKQVPTHAYFHIRHQIILNVGLCGVYIDYLSTYLNKSHAILVIHFKDSGWNIENKLIDVCFHEFIKSKKLLHYDFGGYGSFIPFLNKIFKSSKKLDFCSDNVVDNGQAVEYKFFNGLDSEHTSPADLLLRALKSNDDNVEVRLLKPKGVYNG